MKKFFRFAVFTAIAMTCVIMSGCNAGMIESSYDYDGKAAPVDIKPRKISCGLVKNDVSFGGAVTRAESETLDGDLTITSTMLAKFVKYPEGKADTVKHTYVSLNEVKALNIKATKYMESLDELKDAKLKQVDTDLWQLPFGIHHISLKTVHTVKEKSFVVEDTTFELCQNDISELTLEKLEYQYLQKDSAGLKLYEIKPTFKAHLEEGDPITFRTPFRAWVGTEIPDKPEVIGYDDDDSGWDNIGPGKNRRWIDIIPRFDDNTKGDPIRIAFVAYDSISGPAKQEVKVKSLDWESSKATISEAKEFGKLLSIGDSIFHQPMMKKAVTHVNHGDCDFIGYYDGAAYYLDRFGKRHKFAEMPYNLDDKGWTDKNLPTKNNMEGKLLTSTVSGAINGHAQTSAGEIEIRKNEKKVIDFEYPDNEGDMGIRSITPGKEYQAWRNRYPVYDDGTVGTEPYDEVKVPYLVNVVTPDKQVIDVPEWDLADVKMVKPEPMRNNSREVAVAGGKAKIQKYEHRATTKTNRSSHQFSVFAETEATFTDEFGNTVKMPTMDVSIADKGGVASLTDLPMQDEKERKAMTSTIEVTANKADKATYSAEVEFRKDAKDHLTKAPEVTRNVHYDNGGNWTSTATITYDWQIAGTKTKTITENFFWGITPESKKQVILNEPVADYASYSKSPEQSSTTPSATNEGVTITTKTFEYTEDYTTLKDVHYLKKQTGHYKEVVDGYTVEFDLLAPESMTISHKDASLVDTGNTTTVSGQEYEVWKHTGTVTALVTCVSGNQTETSTVEKEVLVKIAPEPPSHPEWGAVKGFIAATAGYNKDAGESGRFHGVHLIEFEKGVLVVHTESFGGDGNAWTPRDYTYSEADFYTYGVEIDKTWNVNTAMLWEGKWVPALWSWDNNSDNPGWTVECINNKFYKMPSALALTCGIKNFQGSDTAKTTPVLHHSGELKGGKLYVKNEKGGLLYTIW